MRLTMFTDLSLRVVIHLASNEGKRVTIEEAAQACGASRFHLMKVVSRLAQVGIIRSRSGRGGRIELNGSPDSIRLGDVVRAAEEFDLVPCRGGDHKVHDACPVATRCGAAGLLDDALAAFLATLDSKSIHDIVSERNE